MIPKDTKTPDTKLKCIANLIMLLIVLIWGSSFISIKIAVHEIPPITLAFIRFFITSIILYCGLKINAPQTKISKSDYLPLAIAGFVGITSYFCFENTALSLTSASNASLISCLTPIMAIALNVIFFKARLSGLEFIGSAVGLIGAYLTITANGDLSLDSNNFKGNMLMIGAMFSWAVFTLLSKKIQHKYSSLCIVTYQTIFATITLLPLACFEYQKWQPFSPLALAQVIFLAVFCSALGNYLYVYALKILDVTITTIYLSLVPIVGVIAGSLILGETVLPIQLLGGSIIISAILIINLERTFNLWQNQLITKKPNSKIF
ncbi:DMT family transporter [Anaerosinus gibii]|uniref:DMT family transporter n=1 Tax=Selenobaculum gibii TaxID=3054208 RepID=A0A9Y2AJ98_9FIRM|nr:DMT family transporter [Selenobaculum gbiensis]WIW70897.1 DMT family transporter [Selenobaculum gbiensis]